MSTLRSDPASASTPIQVLLRRASRTARRLSGAQPLEGFVDRVLAGEVLGWAFDPNKPHRRVHVVARFDGEIIAETLADLPRKDLSRGGKGDGRHGFNLRIPGRYLDGAPRRLRIEALNGRSRVLLQGGGITVAAARPGLTNQASLPAAPSPGPPEPGRLTQVRDGVLCGWVAAPAAGQPAPVIDIYDDERYLGSATADPSNLDPSTGEASFAFSLPAPTDEAMVSRLRGRVTGARADLLPLPGQARPQRQRSERPASGGAAPRLRNRATRVAPFEGRLALLVHGDGDADAVRRTARSWTEQSWSDIAIGRLSVAPERSSPAGEHVFSGGDAERLATFLAGARTVVLARAGETLESYAAKVLAQARPLSDVLTWEIADRSAGAAARRRVEAWPLAIQLGACLNGGFAVRTEALVPLLRRGLDDLAAGRLEQIEVALASDPGLRWSHLPLALSARAHDDKLTHRPAPAPAQRARTISIAVWPQWSDASLASLQSLLGQAGDADVEIIVPAEGPAASLRRQLADAAPRARITLRPVDPPAQDRPGAWHRAMARAATGEVLVLCRAGVVLEHGVGTNGALEDMAGWALSPLAGAVTGEIRAGDQVLAGLALAPLRHGWRIVSGYQPALTGVSRPVLACSAALMAVERGRVEAAGGFDAHRLPDGGAGFDIGLKLRRAGFASLVLGHVRARADAGVLRRDPGAVLGLHEAGELAAAAAAYPASVEPRAKPQDEA